MKIKPKSVLLDLPSVKFFQDEEDISAFAKVINEFVHSKVKLKCDNLGDLDGRYVGIFYLNRNGEFNDLREFWGEQIRAFEEANYACEEVNHEEVPCQS